MRVFRALALVGILILAGCATLGAPSAAQQAQAQQAQTLYQQGQFDRAADAWMAAAAQGSSASNFYRLSAAEAWRQNGSLDRMGEVLQTINRKHLSATDAQHYDLLSAQVALATGDPTRALQLTSTPINDYPVALRMRVLELRARAQIKSGDTWAAAQTRVSMDTELTGLDQAQNRRQTIKLLTGLGAPALQQHATTLTADDPMQRWVSVALEQLGVVVARAQPTLAHPLGTTLPGSPQAQGYHMPQTLALLLPTTGSLAAAGNAVREGFFTAYFDAGSNGAARPIVKVYDTGSTPAQAVTAYQQAVTDGAQRVIGPLTRDSVTAVLAQPELAAPLLALNHPDGGTLPPPGASEFALMPETEGAEAAEHMHARGLLNATVLVSNEDFAQRAGKAFTVQFEALGGHVAPMQTLDPATINYADQIKTLGANPQDNAGIFISMRPPQARLLLPQLRLAGLTLPVFATSHIYAGTDDVGSNTDLNGVEFCDAPWLLDAQPGLPARSQIAAALPSARGTSARLFAFGMDAWALAPYLDWLRSHPESYLSGATGQLTEDDFGRVRRELAWARFDNGLAHPVSGSLELDAPMPIPGDAPAPPTSATPAAEPLLDTEH